MKFTRQQRLGLLLTGILMVLTALLIALTRPAPAVGAELPDRADPPVQTDSQAPKKKKLKKPAAPPPPPRNPLDEEF